jgi:hypothetical protein
MNNADDIPQSERRRIMAEERQAKATYHSVAIGSVDDERQGRYAQSGQSTSVTGSTPGPIYPEQPPTSPFACDPVPAEPPLGYEIDALEPVGELHERISTSPSPSAVELPAQKPSVGGDEGRVRFRRRV